MPTHKLSETIDDDIRAEVDWSAQDGRSCSAIDDERNTAVVRYVSDAFDIENVQGRIAERFSKKGLRLIIDVLVVVVRISRVY